MKIGTIENVGQNTVERYLQSKASKAIALDWSSAFITQQGLDSVLHLLTATSNRKVRILTGLYQGFTVPAALKTLMKAQNNSRGQIEVRISREQHFHWKAYFLIGKQNCHMVVGSSNLTRDGIRTSGEFNLAVNLPRQSLEFRQAHQVFEQHWSHQSDLLNQAMLNTYTKWYESSKGPIRPRNPPLKSILAKRSKTISVAEPIQINHYRDSVTTYFSKVTEEYVGRGTNWDKKGLLYFNDSKRYKVGDRVILFDYLAGSVKGRVVGSIFMIKIVETTRLPESTPDGHYFAAYKNDKNFKPKKLTKVRMETLKKLGLIKSKAASTETRKLTETQFRQFENCLKEWN